MSTRAIQYLKQRKVFMDEVILSHEKIMINAGQRGTMLKMSPADIRSGLGCLVADV
jgi:prolyl-tRNA editing enzyme YbaK/EbsC (Cys-tRNA(Pro) deacylase)